MIESLSGTLLEKSPGHAVVECHGVGYWVQVPLSVHEQLPALERPVRLHVHYAVTVDVRSGQSEHRLFGFTHAHDRTLFRQLITVQGVSATLGMAILGARRADDLRSAIAGGDSGKGRLAAPDVVVEAVLRALGPRDLEGRRVVVSAGGTREPIDAVRVIANRSSGKQGYAVAEEARRRGASVTLVTTVDRTAPVGVDVVEVETAAQMHEALERLAPQADVIVMAAAVADFRPVQCASGKIKKDTGLAEIRLEPTPDILAGLGARKRPGQILVGFAAETSHLVENAAEKLRRKNLDLIVANDVSAPGVGFQHDTNAVTFLRPDQALESHPLSDKRDIARALLDIVAGLLV